MRRDRTLRCFTVTMSIFGMLAGQLASAAGPIRPIHIRPIQTGTLTSPGLHSQGAAIGDVALHSRGMLQGQSFDSTGVPESGVGVRLCQNGETVATATTDDSGQFIFEGIQAGIYELQTPQSSGVYRLWAPRTAPPVAQPAILIVSGQPIVRGGAGSHPWVTGLGSTLANPWILAMIVAAAIAIPLAVDNKNGS
jgi:hypothetical protein